MPAMSLAYPAAARLADRLLHERLVSRIWDRDPRAWGAAPGSAATTGLANELAANRVTRPRLGGDE